MLEIRIHGRGGQGAQVACQMLASAFFRAGRQVQAFAAYGGERRGAPVTASLRVDDQPIRLRCDIERADYALVLDPTLLADLAPASLKDDGFVLVNSAAAPCSRAPLASRTLAVDARAIAAAAGLGTIVSTAMLGAFAGATGLLTLADVIAAVHEGSPARADDNVEACRTAYFAAADLHATAVVAARP
jgi:2-oxoacid:acceptor oxidoreductase gamma subunit (pyruvate/2-ketoisovalerate family)